MDRYQQEQLTRSFEKLRKSKLHALHGCASARTVWRSLVGDDPQILDQLIDRFFVAVRHALEAPDDRAADDAYRFVATLADASFDFGARARGRAMLLERGDEFLDLLDEALSRPDVAYVGPGVDPKLPPSWGDFVGHLISVPFRLSDAPSDLGRDVATRIPAYYRSFARDTVLLDGFLAEHPDRVAATAEIIRSWALGVAAGEQPPPWFVAGGLIGPLVDKDHDPFRLAPDVFAAVLRDAGTWPEEATDAFAATYVRDELLVAHDEPPLDPEQQRIRAVRHVSTTPSTRKALAVAARALPEAEWIEQLLTDATRHAERPKTLPIPPASDNRFADLGLKLLVIEELMYVQETLEPRFDIEVFADEHDRREIVPADEAGPVPEVRRYFERLAIPDALLAQVTELSADASDVHRQLQPDWDPGMGDAPVPLTARAVADLDLLPNLERITAVDGIALHRRVRKALTARGVELEDD